VLVITSIEAPFTFLQKPIKAFLFYTVKFVHMPLSLVPEIIDTINVISFVGK
tara:strand:+ start:98 stop:253 length:156 start_codon:yes stop_codon:yes gene_type:complete